MPWSEAAAEMAAALTSLEGFAEPSDYASASTSAPVRLNAVWGNVERDADRNGVVADWVQVAVAETDLNDLGVSVSPRRNDRATLTRYPDEIEDAEPWTVGTVSRSDGLWTLWCFRLGRMVPRGAL